MQQKIKKLSHLRQLIGNPVEDITDIDVSALKDIGSLFQYAKDFNQDISKWSMGDVWRTSFMFEGANSFNRDISGWDVGNVQAMSWMFNGATSFNQDLSIWNINSVRYGYLFAPKPNLYRDSIIKMEKKIILKF